MTIPANTLQNVITYQRSMLAYLLNYSCFIHTSNKKFKNFQEFAGNLGDTVTFDLPYRFTTQPTLVSTPQPIVQRVQTLSVDQALSAPYAYSAQQFLFNLDKEGFMKAIGKGAVAEISTQVERFVAGLAESQPYRYYLDGNTALTSVTQLAQLIEDYKAYGFPHGENLKVYLPNKIIPQISSSVMNQFVLQRNESTAMSWMVGDWDGVSFYKSNLLPQHISGNVGNAPAGGNVLTVVSTNDPTGNNITQITFSGAAASDFDAIFANDGFTFNTNVGSLPNLYYTTFVGHIQTGQIPVQCRITAPAGSSGGGLVTVNITPALCATPGNQNQNITYNVVAGMQVTVLPSHICGLVVGGDALYFAMPRLPDQPPFPTSSEPDAESGISLRLTYGSVLGQNTTGWWHDMIYGATAVPEYLMKIVIPLQSI